MKKTTMFLAVSLAGLLGISAAAQTGKPKTQTKKDPTLGAIGTVQMPGAECKIGTTYTLGKKDGSPFNITVTSVEYHAERVKRGDFYDYPYEDEKLLVVRFTIHNPVPREQLYDGTILWTAVSPEGKNYEAYQAYMEAPPHQIAYQPMKPAQKISAFTIIHVPARGPIPKLIAANRADTAPVARYQLGNQVKKLKAPYADPADPSGCSALTSVPAKIGQTLQIGGFEVTVLGIEQFDGVLADIDGSPPEEGKAYVLVSLRVMNTNFEGGNHVDFGGGNLQLELFDADGGSCYSHNQTFRASTNKALGIGAKFGETVTFRRVFTADKGVRLDRLVMKDMREVVVDLGGFTPK